MIYVYVYDFRCCGFAIFLCCTRRPSLYKSHCETYVNAWIFAVTFHKTCSPSPQRKIAHEEMSPSCTKNTNISAVLFWPLLILHLADNFSSCFHLIFNSNRKVLRNIINIAEISDTPHRGKLFSGIHESMVFPQPS